VPFWLALLLGVALVGAPLGAGAGALYFLYYSPFYSYSGRVLDYRGGALDPAGYARAERRTSVEAVGLGAVAGLALAGVAAWLLARRPVYRWRLAAASGLGLLVLGAPAGAGVGGLYYFYFSPYYSPYGGYYDYRGDALPEEQFYLAKRQTEVAAAVRGAGAGLALAAAGAGFYLLRYHRRRARARRRLAGQIQELNAAFPAAVQSWGGVKALEDRARVGEILRAVESGRR
jgi:hypothetical protein